MMKQIGKVRPIYAASTGGLRPELPRPRAGLHRLWAEPLCTEGAWPIGRKTQRRLTLFAVKRLDAPYLFLELGF